MAKLTDPDSLNEATEITLSTSGKTIRLQVAGNLSNAGVTLQCIYSKLKELWRTSTTYPKFPFPLVSITDEQFEIVEGWTWYDSTTINLLRDAGFAVKNTSGVIVEKWMNVSTLGTFYAPTTDQAYYQQVSGAAPVSAAFVNAVNQPIKIYGGVSNGNFDYTGYFKIFLRTQGDVYGYYDLISSQGITALTYKKYSLPLTNKLDAKITHSDGSMSGSPYTGITITYKAGVGFTAFANATVYPANSVVSHAGRWYYTTAGGTSNNTTPGTDTGVTWVSYSGERSIGGTYYAFNKIVAGNSATAEQIFEKVQYQLRQTTDIDAGSGTVRGDTADEFMEFIGDTLRTKAGVYIDAFAAADTNRLEFTDYGGTVRTFPFVAAGKLIFDANLIADASAKYWIYFTDAGGNAWGTSSGILVKDNGGTDLAGNVSAAAEVAWDFDYDGNVQGGRTAGTDADITVIVEGLATAQYNKQTFTITRSVSANNFSVGAGLERNYSNL
jgi:hypothetical protein